MGAMRHPHLLITGDDFGESHQVNEAVERDYQAGFLKQASLLVCGRQLDEAVRIARRNPGLGIGLHLALAEMAPLTRSSSLGVRGGLMENRPLVAGVRYAFASTELKSAIAAEVRAQFERFVELGFSAIYFDGHMHLHLHPTVWMTASEESRRFGFQALRTVRERTIGVTEIVLRKLSARAMLSLCQTNQSPAMFTADVSCGLKTTFRMSVNIVQNWATHLAGAAIGTIHEWIYHPGKEPQEWDAAVAIEILKRHEVEAKSWRDLLKELRIHSHS